MKPMVFALDAQSRVDAEDEISGLCITAYTNMTHLSWRPKFVIFNLKNYELGLNLLSGESYEQCSLS